LAEDTIAPPPEEALWQLVYASAARAGFASSDLDDILRVARDHNVTIDVTGMLLYVDHSFLQVLEGTEGRVNELFDKISKDKRHIRTLLLTRHPIEQRSFAEWTMGCTSASIKELSTAVGINDFFQRRDALFNLGDSKLATLLELFRSGSYRQRIT
jgi:Sensors of blue-light using FAD